MLSNLRGGVYDFAHLSKVCFIPVSSQGTLIIEISGIIEIFCIQFHVFNNVNVK